MPIYDFQCQRCGHRFDQLVKVGQGAPCPACGAAETQRLTSFSATVSTGKTRARTLAIAQGKASAVKKEKDHAHQQYIQNHIKDHS